jgi:membrane-associated protease RseP (regulator of RpoE activity)
MTMDKIPADIAQRIGESLSDIIDVAAVYTSRREILVKGSPLSESPRMKPEIESRLAGFSSEVEILSTHPSLVIRLRPLETTKSRAFHWPNVILFGLTVLTTLTTGAIMEGADWIANPGLIVNDPLRIVLAGLPFSVSLLSILLFHEFGHYIAARIHGVRVSLPYFIPAPPGISPFGTFGAVIKSKSAFLNKRQLLDVAAAGPLAGLVIAVIVIVIGIQVSSVQQLPSESGNIFFGESILFQLITYAIKGPIPEGSALFISSVAFAGWVGILVTMFNLLPFGQLDGGHIAYALIGKWQKNLAHLVMLGLVALSFYWFGWILWILLGFLLKPGHPPTVMDELAIGKWRKLIGIISVIAFVLCFIPVPIEIS